MKNIVVLFLVVGLFSGCLKEEKPVCNFDECANVAPASEVQQVEAYLSANGITATKHCSGMYYAVVSAGSGERPTVCNNISVTYEGSLTDGTVFDRSTSPVAFYLGGNLIEGFRNGLLQARPGGQIRLYIPPSLGYGDRPQTGGNVTIPANSILIFDVTLVGVQ